MQTLRLYYTEPARFAFDATVVAIEPGPDGSRVVLDRTAFYPTSGGQPNDLGTLDGAPVVDVIDDEESDRVVHVVDGFAPAPGASVSGSIDSGRRRDHMQQHTGQHVLSAAFEHTVGAHTVGFHLGRDATTIDLDRDVARADVDRAESLANDVIWSNRPVSIRFVDASEAARLPLRKAPTRDGRLRLIEIADFDLSACGGTHVSHTGEVGQIAVEGWERYKGGTRVSFVCGRRGLAAFRMHRDAVTGAVRTLSVLPAELADGIARLQAQLKDADKRTRALQFELAHHQGAALVRAVRVIGSRSALVEVIDGHDATTLKPLALSACEHGADVAVLLTLERPSLVAVARRDGESFDCGALVKSLCSQFGGRGGGRAEFAQGGGLDAAVADIVSEASRGVEQS